MNQKRFSSNALREGRIARGYSKTELASNIGISRQAIDLHESGEAEPKPDTLEKFSTALQLPPTYFYRNPIEDFSKESHVFFRKLKRATDFAYEGATIKAKWHYSGYLELTKYLKRIEPNIPKFCLADNFEIEGLGQNAIEDYAKQLRSFWGLRLGPIVGLTPLLEKNGIIVFQLNVQSDLNGFSFYANGGIPFLMSGKNVTAGRNRFNLAHELAHLVLHSATEKSELSDELVELIEDQANNFAGAFLFPKERFIDEFVFTDLNYLVDLKLKWGMSITAMIERAYNLGILTVEEKKRFYQRHRGIRSKEPKDDEIQIEHPTFPKNGLRAILDANLITIDDIKFELPYSIDDLSEIFSIEKNVFNTQKVSPLSLVQFKEPA